MEIHPEKPTMSKTCTVIIPTIGRPRYFEKSLACVLAQTYEPLEILVSDNAAQPPVPESALQPWLSQGRIRLIRRNDRLPYCVHFNKCLEEASGDYVMFFSDDDLISPNYVSSAIACFEEMPEMRVVISEQKQINEQFEGPIDKSSLLWDVFDGDRYIFDWHVRHIRNGVLTTVSMLADRKRILASGAFGNYPAGSDADNVLFMKLALGGKVGVLKGGHYYRVYEQSYGLSIPWRDLVMDMEVAERELRSLVDQGRLSKQVLGCIVQSQIRLLFRRWMEYYRHRPSLSNKVAPLLDLSVRIPQKLLSCGPKSIPILWRFFP
jgi:glycosyltransferase involved in cell wall biosynthesis